MEEMGFGVNLSGKVWSFPETGNAGGVDQGGEGKSCLGCVPSEREVKHQVEMPNRSLAI